MLNALIIPSERPVSIQEVKRALLSYDKIYLASPDDRDIIPENVYNDCASMAVGIPPLGFMSFSRGPVRPLGKVQNFDRDFERTFKELKLAFDQGALEILPTPMIEKKMTLGGIPPFSEFEPDPFFTYQNFRHLAENEAYVNTIGKALAYNNWTDEDLKSLDVKGLEDGEMVINERVRTEKKKYNDANCPDDLNGLISSICHAKLGVFSKYWTIAGNNNMQPFSCDIGYSSLINKLEKEYGEKINSLDIEDENIKRLKTVALLEDVLFSQFIDENKLRNLSVKEVLELRTKSWGKNQENRKELHSVLNDLSLEVTSSVEFKRECKRLFNEFKSKQDDYEVNNWILGAKVISSAAATSYLTESYVKSPNLDILIFIAGLSYSILNKESFGILNAIRHNMKLKKHAGYTMYKSYPIV